MDQSFLVSNLFIRIRNGKLGAFALSPDLNSPTLRGNKPEQRSKKCLARHYTCQHLSPKDRSTPVHVSQFPGLALSTSNPCPVACAYLDAEGTRIGLSRMLLNSSPSSLADQALVARIDTKPKVRVPQSLQSRLPSCNRREGKPPRTSLPIAYYCTSHTNHFIIYLTPYPSPLNSNVIQRLAYLESPLQDCPVFRRILHPRSNYSYPLPLAPSATLNSTYRPRQLLGLAQYLVSR